MNTDLNPNPLVRFLGKPCRDFTRADLIRYVKENGIEMINLRYPGADGRLKTLNFVINDETYLESILTCGERVDGSSLFPYIEAGSSDLYVVPRYRTAFRNPFSEIPSLDILCSYYTKDGEPFDMAPEQALRRAHEELRRVTGFDFHVMGELEFYVVSPKEDLFLAADQRGYHESTPFNKAAEFRMRAMQYIAQAGGEIKYGHSEVGNFTQEGLMYEQNEIEFLPTDLEAAADQLLVAKWIIRTLAYEYGVDVTFAPKITVGKAGSGMHIHMRIMKDGRNMMLTPERTLSVEARKAIAGMMDLAQSITAFGNKNPMSWLRLVPHQEAPTNICWGMSNRSVLVRVPLGWTSGRDMCMEANPNEPHVERDYTSKQTVEMRSPDGSADIFQLLAGLCVACRHGFEMPNAEEVAEQTFADGDIHAPENAAKLAAMKALPDSCAASADCLEQQRAVYEEYGVFSPKMIDGILKELRAFNDRTMRDDIAGDDSKLQALVERHFHCG